MRIGMAPGQCTWGEHVGGDENQERCPNQGRGDSSPVAMECACGAGSHSAK
jgi:hypothetical protein